MLLSFQGDRAAWHKADRHAAVVSSKRAGQVQRFDCSSEGDGAQLVRWPFATVAKERAF